MWKKVYLQFCMTKILVDALEIKKILLKNIAKVVKLTGDMSFSVDLHIRLGKLQVQHFGHFGHVCQ